MWELQKYVDGLTETFFWHQGRCPSYGDGVDVLGAGRDGARSRADRRHRRRRHGPRRVSRRASRSYVPDAEERRWIEPRLGQLIGLDGGSGDRDELFGAWRRFFERVAEHGTTVLVFEDLHWADPGLLDFVESLLEWSRTSPVLVLSPGSARARRPAPNWGSGVRSASRPAPGPPRRPRRSPRGHGLRRWSAGRTVSHGSWRAPRACRCTPSRRSGCWRAVGCSSRPASPTSWSGTSATSSTSPRPCTRSSRRGSTTCPTRSATLVQDASRGRAQLHRRGGLRGRRARRSASSSRCCGPSSARRSSTRTSTRARPSAGSTGSSSR